MQEARIELLQRMAIFGRNQGGHPRVPPSASCKIVSAPTNEFFFREHQQGDWMLVLELGHVAVLKSWSGQAHFLQTLKEGHCFREMAGMDHCPRSASVRAGEDCIAIQI